MHSEKILHTEEGLPKWKVELMSAFGHVENLARPDAKEQRRDFFEQDQKLSERTKDAEVLYRYLRRFIGLEIDIQETEPGIFELPSKKLDDIPQLPDGYGYKGGVARASLESTLGLSPSSVRDFDIIFLADSEDKKLSDELAQKYMPDDYKSGYGVESLKNDYFKTRDFTLNEVYVDRFEKIRATRQCILDTVRRVLRVTDYEKGEYLDDQVGYGINPKILAKALRFMARERSRGKPMEFADIDAVKWVGIDSFHMALHLDRAMEQGEDTANNYVEELIYSNQLPPDVNTPEAVAAYLKKDLYDFVFKAPRLKGSDGGLTAEEEDMYWEEEFESLSNLPLFESSSKAINTLRK